MFKKRGDYGEPIAEKRGIISVDARAQTGGQPVADPVVSYQLSVAESFGTEANTESRAHRRDSR